MTSRISAGRADDPEQRLEPAVTPPGDGLTSAAAISISGYSTICVNNAGATSALKRPPSAPPTDTQR